MSKQLTPQEIAELKEACLRVERSVDRLRDTMEEFFAERKKRLGVV